MDDVFLKQLQMQQQDDQAITAVKSLAGQLSAFYQGLRAEEVPPHTAAALTLELMRQLFAQNRRS